MENPICESCGGQTKTLRMIDMNVFIVAMF